MAATSAQAVRSCKTCQSLESSLNVSLKQCATCKTTLYCSKECQKADWKSHKLVCSPAPTPASATPKNFAAAGRPRVPQFNVTAVNPMELRQALDSKYLHSVPEKDAFGMLIDSFRLRVEDEYVYGINTVGLYNDEDPLHAFREFLDLSESRQGTLPPWWNAAKRKQCERMAVNPSGWNNINCAIEKQDIIEHYGDSLMPMKLRKLAEKIYGKALM